MVTSPHYLASEAGLKVLRDGGNAVNAAIAMAAELSVVYPHMSTAGGDNFWLIWNEARQELKALNASGRSTGKATIDFYIQQGLSKIPSRGYLAALTVPGAVSGWQAAYQYACRSLNANLPWSELLAPAIDSAENGIVVSPSLARCLAINTTGPKNELRNLQRFDGFKKVFLKADGTPYQQGELLIQSDLAGTLKLISAQGAAVFYSGEIAAKIVDDLQANGGLLSKSDFREHEADWVEPISVSYRGYGAYNLPPNTQGFASLSILRILDNYDIKALGEGTADYYHLIVEATKQAFADRDRYLTDPGFVNIPLDYLLSQNHAEKLSSRISMQEAAAGVKPLDAHGDTVWFAAVDRQGNAVSAIQSIYYDFGSAIIPQGTGVLLQNRGVAFSLEPQEPNQLAPRKRTSHTLNPAMLFKDEKPYLLYGTMGGDGQPQTQAALVTRIIDFGFSPQEAVGAPRWLYGRSWGAGSNDLKLEGRIPETVAAELRRRGHRVTFVDDYSETMGHAGAILINRQTGEIKGAADPRSDGLAKAL
jgi:oxamate amidohydrolase